jgi:hypothetical protein
MMRFHLPKPIDQSMKIDSITFVADLGSARAETPNWMVS